MIVDNNVFEKLQSIEELMLLNAPILTIEGVTKFTGLSQRTIYKKTCEGVIPHYKQSGKLYFDREEIVAWLKANRGFYVGDVHKASANHLMKQKMKEVQNG